MHCYAEREAARIQRMNRGQGKPEGEGAYDGLVQITSQGPKWTGQIRLVPEKLSEPLRRRKPALYFVNSMSDMFHEDVPLDYIAQVWAAMAYARQHTFQILTKRAERMLMVLTSEEFAELFEQYCGMECDEAEQVLARRGEFSVHERRTDDIRAFDPQLPLANVQLGVSTEDQERADERIPALLLTPAAVRFVSVEPMLGPVNLSDIPFGESLLKPLVGIDWRPHRLGGSAAHAAPGRIDWVIVGGESGEGARLMKAEWVRAVRDECITAGVPFFFKQWGGVNKKEAGRLLDGVEWNQMPTVGVGHV